MFFEVKASIRRQINCSKVYGMKKIRKFIVLTSSICSSIYIRALTNYVCLNEKKKTFLYGIVFCVSNVPLRNAQRFFYFNFFSATFFSYLFSLNDKKNNNYLRDYSVLFLQLFFFCVFRFIYRMKRHRVSSMIMGLDNLGEISPIHLYWVVMIEKNARSLISIAQLNKLFIQTKHCLRTS